MMECVASGRKMYIVYVFCKYFSPIWIEFIMGFAHKNLLTIFSCMEMGAGKTCSSCIRQFITFKRVL